jgi:hypothetical protein
MHDSKRYRSNAADWMLADSGWARLIGGSTRWPREYQQTARKFACVD